MTSIGQHKRLIQIAPLMVPPSGINHDWSDISTMRKFGNNPDIDTATTPEDVWSYGGTYTFLSSAATLYASSSDAGDAVEITVEGLDADWNVQTSTVTLNGQSQVEIGSGLTWIRCYRAYNSDSTDLAGDVYVAESDTLTGGVPDTASKVKAMIVAAEQQTNMAIYTIPAGYTGYFMRGYISQVISRSSYAVVELRARLFGGVFRTGIRDGLVSTGSSRIDQYYPIPAAYPPKTDIKATVTEVGANNMDISAGFDLLLVKNSS